MTPVKVLLTKAPLPVWVVWSTCTLITPAGVEEFSSREALKGRIQDIKKASITV